MSPPENDIILKFLLGFTATGLSALVIMLWGTREMVQKIHADATNPRSGFAAIWEAIDALREDFNTSERERHESPRPNPHG